MNGGMLQRCWLLSLPLIASLLLEGKDCNMIMHMRMIELAEGGKREEKLLIFSLFQTVFLFCY